MSSDHSASPPPLAPDSNIKVAATISYWNSVSPDVNGMLGGFPQISRIDLQGSKNFIAKIRRLDARNGPSINSSAGTDSANGSGHVDGERPSKKIRLAVDCGAGIGRITEGMLTQVCDVVDIVEPVEKFAKALQHSELKQEGKVGDIYIEGLQAWQPSKRYDLIWNQWCVGHLTDAQLVEYLGRAAQALTEKGWLIVKENLSTNIHGEDLFDDLDSSVTRSDMSFRRLFEEANLDVVKSEVQKGFPKSLGLYPVKMYALRPKTL